ncbi:MAG: OmpH family outer membrane protein [Muribaculaceae bacterium]|nr:OmpH family outer membrane protein [Muribaculaceae bacterium]
MFKKILLAVALALPMSAMAQKFGVVDLASVFEAMPETTAMQTQLTETSKKYEDEFQKLQEEFNKLYTDYQTIVNDANTPDSIKQRRMQEIQERGQKIEQFQNTAQQDLARLQQSLMAPIQTKIQDAVKAVGTEGAFTLVLPNDPGTLLYVGNDVTDITPLVRTKLGLK